MKQTDFGKKIYETMVWDDEKLNRKDVFYIVRAILGNQAVYDTVEDEELCNILHEAKEKLAELLNHS